MSPTCWGVVTHQACPIFAFSAKMAGLTGMVTPSASLVLVTCAVAVPVAGFVAVAGVVVRAVAGWPGPLLASENASATPPAATMPPVAAKVRGRGRGATAG